MPNLTIEVPPQSSHGSTAAADHGALSLPKAVPQEESPNSSSAAASTAGVIILKPTPVAREEEIQPVTDDEEEESDYEQYFEEQGTNAKDLVAAISDSILAMGSSLKQSAASKMDNVKQSVVEKWNASLPMIITLLTWFFIFWAFTTYIIIITLSSMASAALDIEDPYAYLYDWPKDDETNNEDVIIEIEEKEMPLSLGAIAEEEEEDVYVRIIEIEEEEEAKLPSLCDIIKSEV